MFGCLRNNRNYYKMAVDHKYHQWLNENGALVDLCNTARAPAKDFFHIFVSPTEVVYRLWKIVPPTRLDNHPLPTEIKDSWEDFMHDEKMHSEIQRVSGEKLLDYLLKLVEGHIDYLNRLPKRVLLVIIKMLDLESMAQLSSTCGLFRELCNDNKLWEEIYKMHNKLPITNDLLVLAEQKGWRNIFFTNKLQLQMLLRRVQEMHKRSTPVVGTNFFKN